jgi:hypothetical protein
MYGRVAPEAPCMAAWRRLRRCRRICVSELTVCQTQKKRSLRHLRQRRRHCAPQCSVTRHVERRRIFSTTSRACHIRTRHERRHDTAGGNFHAHDNTLMQPSNTHAVGKETDENDPHQDSRLTETAGVSEDDGDAATETAAVDRSRPALRRQRSLNDGG